MAMPGLTPTSPPTAEALVQVTVEVPRMAKRDALPSEGAVPEPEDTGSESSSLGSSSPAGVPPGVDVSPGAPPGLDVFPSRGGVPSASDASGSAPEASASSADGCVPELDAPAEALL